MIVVPQEFPERCPKHGTGVYERSLTCPTCRAGARSWILWAAFELVPPFTHVAFRGSSGSAFGWWLADELGLSPIYVVKPGENHHGSRGLRAAEESFTGVSWIFLDDFISAGRTYEACREAIGHHASGIITYESQSPLYLAVPSGVQVVNRGF